MRAAVVVSVASLAMAVVVGCGSTIVPDKAAQSVADYVSKRKGFKPNDVKCPSGVDAKVGTEFDCTFTGSDGQYNAHLRVAKVDGDDVQFYIETKPTGG
jgi:Domain of unknown function (DUF4333)